MGLPISQLRRVASSTRRLLLALFAAEGVTGMVPAIYMDLGSNGLECNATQSLGMTAEGYVAGHILLFSLLPYLVPLLACLLPAWQLYRWTAPESRDDDVYNDMRDQAR